MPFDRVAPSRDTSSLDAPDRGGAAFSGADRGDDAGGVAHPSAAASSGADRSDRGSDHGAPDRSVTGEDDATRRVADFTDRGSDDGRDVVGHGASGRSVTGQGDATRGVADFTDRGSDGARNAGDHDAPGRSVTDRGDAPRGVAAHGGTPRGVHATIHDVAREAGVSVASVSRVLNGRDHVRPAMRTRVEEAAARLGYVPHAGARGLSLARTGAIGVVLPDLHGEFFSELLRGMDRAAGAHGLGLLLTVLHDGRGLDALAGLRGQVDGLVVMAPQLDPAVLAAHMPRGVAALYLNCAGDDAAARLRIDNRAGAAAMIAHLAAGGARRIVHLSGPAGNVDAEERRAGAQAAAAQAGVALSVIEGDFREGSGAIVAECVAAGTLEADAIFAANDMMAIGALMTLKRLGVAVPGQVMVAGFDDIPLAGLVTPALTTMRVDIAALGARAVTRLAARIGQARSGQGRSGQGMQGFVEEGPADGTGTEAIVPQLAVRETTVTTDRETGS